MATVVNGPTDLGQPGKYKIVLSPALQGRSTKEVYTGIRYNHKPDLPSTQESSELVPTDDDSSFKLSLSDGNEKYSYEGTRTSGDGQYVLIFDPAEQHFVLHQMDSSFDMNLTSTPWEQNIASLRTTYEQLGPQPKTGPTRRGKGAATSKAAASSSSALNSAPSGDKKAKAGAKPKKQQQQPPPPPPPLREPTPDAEDEESDDGLTIEYPGGKPPPRFASHNVTPLYRATQPSSQQAGSDVDAEGEDDEEDVAMAEGDRDVEDLEPPSPMGNADLNMDDEDAELDLEAELELALEKETGGAADESSESEEE